MNYGQPVGLGDLQRGDIAVIAKGHMAGETGGHVGFATGETRTIGGQTQIQVLSGNTGSNQVGLGYYNAADVTLRRAPNVQGPPVPAPGAAAAAASGTTPQILGVTPASIDEQVKLLKDREAEIQRNLAADKLFGVEQEARIARDRAEAEASKLPLDPEHQKLYVEKAVAEVYERNAIAIAKQTAATEFDTGATLKSVDAYRQSEAAGIASEAQHKAEAEARDRYMTVVGHEAEIQQRTIELLKEQGAAATLAGAQQIAAAAPVLDRQQALADAALKGAEAEKEAQLAAAADGETHDALAKAMALYSVAVKSGNEAEIKYAASLVETAKRENEVALAQQKRAETQTETIAAAHDIRQGRDDAAILQAKLSLVGETSEETQRQISLLRSKQELLEKYPALVNSEDEGAKKVVADYLAGKAAVADMTKALAEAQAAQQRFNDLIRGVADTIDQTLVQAISDAFDGKKIDDWGTRVRAALKSIATQISDQLFIRPFLGTLAQGFGASPIGNCFGTFAGVRN
jgi:hypothetical protein